MWVGVYIMRRTWCNGFSRRKWTRWPEFKSGAKPFAFHMALGKGMNPTTLPPAMVNSWADWLFNLGITTSLRERKLWVQTCGVVVCTRIPSWFFFFFKMGCTAEEYLIWSYLALHEKITKHSWKWTRRAKFKPWTGLFVFHFVLRPLGRTGMHLFSPWLSINSTADWCLLPWLELPV